MIKRKRDRSLGGGVYYNADDYLGIGPRIVILIVDGLALLAIVALVTSIYVLMLGDVSPSFFPMAVFWCWIYEVPLKRSSHRTLGYRLMGVKLVTLKGETPSILMLSLRSMLWMFGPFNLLFDIVWVAIDVDRQTVRDRYTSMCLVRNDANPIGTGEVHLAYFNAGGYSLAYPHVVHSKVAEQ
ncbi:MAG: putative RDD family membrane protein YckC [Pirellulaceae bacterium]|jgi:uncharacterized RDD family membrane protein YckC